MIFISAGFDAHREDELGQLGLVEADYDLDHRAASRRWPIDTPGGRIVSCLEGGYNLGALARSVAAHLRVLTGGMSLERPHRGGGADGIEGRSTARISTIIVAAADAARARWSSWRCSSSA